MVEQLAGDLLSGATHEQVIASGFHANAMLDPNLRHEAVLDQVNTTGTLFLGLTVGCAVPQPQDPTRSTQREYYALYAFFDSATIAPFELATTEEKAVRDQAQARVDAVKKRLAEHEATLKESLAAWEAGLDEESKQKLPAPALAALSTTGAVRTSDQLSKLLAARAAGDPTHRAMTREIEITGRPGAATASQPGHAARAPRDPPVRPRKSRTPRRSDRAGRAGIFASTGEGGKANAARPGSAGSYRRKTH